MSQLLNTINSPADLRKLSKPELQTLSDELREYVLQSVSKTGGHLSSNLGTVELTVALHKVFNTPDDRIVWDVGHQTYPHKILTGRRDRMSTLRQLGGLSGFPQRAESVFDAFGTAHSSTSISAALGMAVAAKLNAKTTGTEEAYSIAVIGDGAMSAGQAFEALNNAGVEMCRLIVILNDNDMSISPAVGALNRYLAQLMSGKFYAGAKHVGKAVLQVAPPLFAAAKRFEKQMKGMVVPANLFENFGLNYIGPIDGHDLDSLIPTLENIKQLAADGAGPQFLHVVTKKGQGYKLAEADPVAYHGPGKFDPAEGLKKAASPAKPTFTSVFGQWLCDMGEKDKRLVGITPAMREGSGLVEFERRFPDRYFDVGIAEQHAVTFAAGLACEGLKPVVAIYSTFLQRAYDQMIHDVAYDIAFTRCIPNMSIAMPADEAECRALLTTAFEQNHPVAVRYPRGAGVGTVPAVDLQVLPFGKGEIRRTSASKKIAILSFGTLLYPALEAAGAVDATVANMRWAKPLDEALVLELAVTHDVIVTVEDGAKNGGAGSAVLECLANAGIAKPALVLGLADEFIEHGDPAVLMAMQGLDAKGIAASLQKFTNKIAKR
jgi:1-deoxy-D-xylulose-5-phosphate synthase